MHLEGLDSPRLQSPYTSLSYAVAWPAHAGTPHHEVIAPAPDLDGRARRVGPGQAYAALTGARVYCTAVLGDQDSLVAASVCEG